MPPTQVYNEKPGRPHAAPTPPDPMHATILSTYPPRGCGLATFARDLRGGLASAGVTAGVIASVHTVGAPGRAPEVSREIDQDRRPDYAAAARGLDPSTDVVCVQHEFGIFGGPEGAYVTDFMDASPCPVVTTLHTVLPRPSGAYRRALAAVVEASDRLVVMTETARELLGDVYRVPASKVSVVPHGTPVVSAPAPGLRERLGLGGRTVLITFGLLGPSKGIEFALDALAPVAEAHPDVLYVVLGATHPEIVAREGEAYRESLQATINARGLGDHVRFVDRYVDGPELGEWLQASDVYVSPYPGMDQICSGTLAYALAAGLPVVSTPYLHAAEVLADGAGALVPYGDVGGFAAALARFAESPEARAEAGRRAREIGAPTAWPETGEAYRRVFEEVVAEAGRQRAGGRRDGREPDGRRAPGPFAVHPGALPAALDALDRLTDDVGPVQHTVYGVPDRRHGYSADDAARALVAAYGAMRRVSRPPASLLRLAQTCLAFLRHAQRPDGAFHNFMSFERRFLDSRGGDDTTGRAIWGLGATVRWAPDGPSQRLALELTERALADDLHHPCARAYAVTGLDLALGAVPDHGTMRAALARLAGGLADQFEQASAPDWRWFSDAMTYANALLPHALLRAAEHVPDQAERFRRIAADAADFALDRTVVDGRFDAVGNDGWLTRHGHRAVYDQQPIEAGYAAWFWADAAATTGDRRYGDAARLAVEWFYGRNRAGEALFDAASGACFDGLTPEGVNQNQGAESVIASVLAHLAAVDLGLVQSERTADAARSRG